ncbi:MAG: glycine--tRNA ligase subunit beta [Deltaproteobacteria bacterium]|nr:glycine--tRNA ligase subunit beta [Deltaproteobacteria bacterium]
MNNQEFSVVKVKDLFLEIGTEEIPAGFIPKALDTIKNYLGDYLEKDAKISFQGIRTMGTPRRLVIYVQGVAEKQEDAVVETTGPAKRAAFDENGKPTKAAQGFARSQGIKVEDLKIVQTEKGEYIHAKKVVKGKKTKDILQDVLPKLIAGGTLFPKAMRWGNSDIAFARPIHWIVAMLGKDIIPFKVGDIKAGKVSYGHRFMKPQPFKVTGFKDYLKKTKASYVIADIEERKKSIQNGIEKEAKTVQGFILQDQGLLDEVTNLVEYPIVLRGGFDKEFLILPKDVVVNAMREHQRYFSVIDKDDNLLPYFITVANTKAKEPKVVVKGNERVLRARLSDAKFYFDKDIKIPLKDRVETLKDVVFQARLGTSYEKTQRFTRLAVYIGSELRHCSAMDAQEQPGDFLTENYNPKNYDPQKTDPGLISKLIIGRSSMLCKADLVSGMVGEFPKLQGVMGMEYARISGECADVARTIYEHYLPTQAGGKTPSGIPGAVISIADKMDTICGCFNVGLIPTGAADPYALRRQALGIIAIIIEKGFPIDIDRIIEMSIYLLNPKPTRASSDVKRDALLFFKERLRNQLMSQGYSFDAVDAVLSAPWYDINDAVKRVKALERFKKNHACGALVIAFKRVSNILRGPGSGGMGQEKPDVSLFEDVHEKELFEIAERISPEINKYWKEGDYEKVFETLASLKGIIDTFFDKVMVMVEDEKIRRNRLVLLNMIRNLYYQIADMSKMAA